MGRWINSTSEDSWLAPGFQMIQPRLIQRAQMSTRLPRDFEFVHFNALGWCQRPAAGLFLRDCVTQVCRCSVICPLPALVTRFVWVVCHWLHRASTIAYSPILVKNYPLSFLTNFGGGELAGNAKRLRQSIASIVLTIEVDGIMAWPMNGQFTAENAAEMARRAAESKRKRLEELRNAVAVAANDPSLDYIESRLRRVRLQLDKVDAMLLEERDPQKLDRLASASARLSEQERQLSNRPMPGSLKPSAKQPRVTPQAEPTPIAPQPVASDDPPATTPE